MSSVFFKGAPTPCPSSFNLAAYVLDQARSLDSKSAITIANKTKYENWTYSELLTLIHSITIQLQNRAIGENDVLLMRLGNTLAFPATYLAAIAIGAIPVPTSPCITKGFNTAL